MIKGKSPEEIRKTFNIQNDFTPEEEDQIRRENEWAEEYVDLQSHPRTHWHDDLAASFYPPTMRERKSLFLQELRLTVL